MWQPQDVVAVALIGGVAPLQSLAGGGPEWRWLHGHVSSARPVLAAAILAQPLRLPKGSNRARRSGNRIAGEGLAALLAAAQGRIFRLTVPADLADAAVGSPCALHQLCRCWESHYELSPGALLERPQVELCLAGGVALMIAEGLQRQVCQPGA